MSHKQRDREYALLYRIGYYETVKKLKSKGYNKLEIQEKIMKFIDKGEPLE